MFKAIAEHMDVLVSALHKQSYDVPPFGSSPSESEAESDPQVTLAAALVPTPAAKAVAGYIR